MIKWVFGVTVLTGGLCGSLFAQSLSTQTTDCSKLTSKEQAFAAQIITKNNKRRFCSQFTPAQRQQAMQLMGQLDGNGNPMDADQAIQRVAGSSAQLENKGGASLQK
jgi:hypothetical protein